MSSARHVDYYLDECSRRFSRLESRGRGKLLYRLVQQAAAIGRAPFQSILEGNPGNQAPEVLAYGAMQSVNALAITISIDITIAIVN